MIAQNWMISNRNSQQTPQTSICSESEDPEIPELEPAPQSEPVPLPKPAKKRKRVAKAGGDDVATTRKKKEQELV